jgi:membrane-bound lytic murein transglycosylase D
MLCLRAFGTRCLPAFVLCVATPAAAVDFKIDLPRDMGVRSNLSAAASDTFDFPDNLGDDDNAALVGGAVGGGASVPQPGGLGSTAGESPKAVVFSRNVAKVNDPDFPTPKCLVERVSFWEAVYRDVDVDSVLLHDRENLGRIYGVARLSRNPTTRSYAADVYRNFYSTKLRELAASWHAPEKWDSTHRELARHFSRAELVPDVLLRASQNIRIQSGLKRHFEDGIQRSLPIVGTIHQILEKQGVPEDIVILPHVESSYSTRAVSKVGAKGLWQIMPGTMRQLMGKNSVARRSEVYDSTFAAAKLLKQNYEKTKSWPLALTAYNHGVNGVMKAIQKTGSRDLCTIIERYESPSFRFASSNFYAQFLAARNVALPRYADLVKSGNGPKALKPLLARKLGVKL